MKGNYLVLLALLAFLASGLTSCLQEFGFGPKPEPPGTLEVEATGTVVFVELEGGFYGIITDDGARYDPVNLPPEFQRDGLRVRFRARILKDTASIHMWGTPVEILHIEELESPRF